MKQKISAVAIALVLSACGTTTTYDYPNGKPSESGYTELEQQGPNSFSSKGILGLKNLSEASSYFYMRGKKTNGETVEERKILELPDSAYVLMPEFSNQNLIRDYLQSKGADIAKTETFFPGVKKGHLSISDATMPNKALKKLMKCDAYEAPIDENMQESIRNIYNAVFAQSKESVMVVPVWRNQKEEVEARLFDVMVNAAYEGAKNSSDRQVTLCATNQGESNFLMEAVRRKAELLKKGAPSSSLSGGHTTAATSRLVGGETLLHQGLGPHSVAGAAADFGGFKLLGVMTSQAQPQEHSSLLVGRAVGSGFYAIGVELGTEKRELTYSSVKAATFYTIHQNWTLSAGVSAISEKLSIPFIGAKSLDRKGVMGELGAHFTQSFQDIKLMGDVGARVFYGGQIQSALFGQVSLVSSTVKTSAFVSSIDAGLNVSYED